jgi:hypothetical protein
VHTNSVLVRADSSAEAHSRALALGRAARSSYRNRSGQKVTVRFLGLHELNVLHDRLEHGAEISYRERIVRSAGVAKKLVKPKGRPGVFAPRQPNRTTWMRTYAPAWWRLAYCRLPPLDERGSGEGSGADGPRCNVRRFKGPECTYISATQSTIPASMP